MDRAIPIRKKAARDELTAAFAMNVKHSGETKGAERHGDGGGLGLMLNVQPRGTKSWVQSLVILGKRRTFGIGGYPSVSLKRAREVARENKRIAREGGDPLAEREALKRRAPPSFADAAHEVIGLLESGWSSVKSRTQWESSLRNYAYPRIGRMRVDAITSADVIGVLSLIWATKRETASRVRQRISAVMRWSIACGHRLDDPAGEAVLQVLPRGRAPVKHHRALPYFEVGRAITRIHESNAALATKLGLEFLILTAGRSGEVRSATWDEVDMVARIWTVPAARMKARRAHRVPLTDRCVEILHAASSIPNSSQGLIFPSPRGKVLSDNTLSKLLRDLGVPAVPHGFRSTFRDWASERTSTSHAVMEAALAHVIPNAVEAAYARSDLLESRRRLMQSWSAFVAESVQ